MPDNVKIDVHEPTYVSQKNTIQVPSCFWQEEKIHELYNKIKIPYKIIKTNGSEFGCYIRHPDKNILKKYMEEATEVTVLALSNAQTIQKHVTLKTYDQFTDTLKDSIRRRVFRNLGESTLITSLVCPIQTPYRINFETNQVIDTNNKKINIHSFCDACFPDVR